LIEITAGVSYLTFLSAKYSARMLHTMMKFGIMTWWQGNNNIYTQHTYLFFTHQH